MPTALKQLGLETLRELRENMPQVKQCAQEALPNGDELQFGFVPVSLYHQAQKTDYRVRLGAIEEIQQTLGTIEDVHELNAHVGDFVDFLIDTLHDANFKIQLTTLNIVGDLVTLVGTGMIPHLGILIPRLIKVELRIIAMVSLMYLC